MELSGAGAPEPRMPGRYALACKHPSPPEPVVRPRSPRGPTFWSSATVTVANDMMRSSAPGRAAASPIGDTLRVYSRLTFTSRPTSRCLRGGGAGGGSARRGGA